jgi:HEAT repeat protein
VEGLIEANWKHELTSRGNMKTRIWKFAGSLALIAMVTAASAADGQSPSAEKARQAMSTLQSDAPPADKAMACKQLAIYGGPEAVPALAPLLADKELASWSRLALEVIPGKAVDEALRNAARKLEGRLLIGVINSIGVRRDARAVNILEKRLQETDAEVASAAAVALGRIGGDNAAGALQKHLAKSPAGVRSAVAQGCVLCAERFLAEKKHAKAVKLYELVRKADVPKQRRLEATRGVILAKQGDGLPILLETLRSPDKALFGLGLRTARELPGRAATEGLIAELGRISPDKRGALLLALADRDDDAVLPAILATARSGSENLRLLAVEILSRLGSPRGVPVLMDALSESNAEFAELVQAAKSGLVGWSGKEVDEQLMQRLPRSTGSSRLALIELAGLRHVTAAVPELARAANENDSKTRDAAIKALGETVGAEDLSALTGALGKARSEEEVAVVQAALESACTRIPDKAACAGKLLPHLAASPVSAKCALLRVLGLVATPNALDAVQVAVANPQPAVSDTAIRVLADWPESPALPALLNLLRTSENETHRFLALRGCLRLLEGGDQPASQKLSTYTELLAGTQRTDDRKAILSGLAKVADPAALKLVEPFLADAQVQAEAELAALTIAGGIAKSSPAEARAVAARIQAESKNQATRDRAAKVLAQINKAGSSSR